MLASVDSEVRREQFIALNDYVVYAETFIYVTVFHKKARASFAPAQDTPSKINSINYF